MQDGRKKKRFIIEISNGKVFFVSTDHDNQDTEFVIVNNDQQLIWRPPLKYLPSEEINQYFETADELKLMLRDVLLRTESKEPDGLKDKDE